MRLRVGNNSTSPISKPAGAMPALQPNWRLFGSIILAILLLFIWNEFLVYYVVLLQCRWPQLGISDSLPQQPRLTSDALKVMVIADTHLLGSREGHWFDKLRREWQMERAFQTAMMLHDPELVFVLGDLFDEGKWCSELEFEQYVARFHRVFRHPSTTDMQVVVGNHDIGFHYMIDDNKRKRFQSAFGAQSVRLFRKKQAVFVMLNSMAFEGDKCHMCKEADDQLNSVLKSLNCAQGNIEKDYCSNADLFTYTKPIILQHFPMYRQSDLNCSGPDSATGRDRYKKFEQKYDCLSQDMTNKLLAWLKPRLIIGAHTHHFCQQTHPGNIPEWTVPSFSWRNKVNPSFLLMALDGERHAIHKCYMPDENTVIYTYIVGGVMILLFILYRLCCFRNRLSSAQNDYYGYKTH